MSLFDILGRVVENFEKKAEDYRDSYSKQSSRASKMSDDELKSSIKNMNASDMRSAGKMKAMVDEYNSRKND